MVIVMNRKKSNLFGVGINDADYLVSPRTTGKRTPCKIYSTWAGMLKRCYSKKYQAKRPTYSECTVCEEWLTFSNFKAWMEKQDWRGKALDKDIINLGNKVYCPEFCTFVSLSTNNFLILFSKELVGSSVCRSGGKFRARCKNPITKKECYLGVYDKKEDAHKAWAKEKKSIAAQLAGMESDERTKDALMRIYSSLSD